MPFLGVYAAMAFMGMVIAGMALMIVGTIAFLMILFLIIGIVLKVAKKKKASIVMFVLSGVDFLILASVAVLIFGPHRVEVETPDGTGYVRTTQTKHLSDMIAEGDISDISSYLDRHPNLVFYMKNGKTILENALENNDIELAQCALDHGAEFDAEFVYDHLVYEGSFERYFISLWRQSITDMDIETVRFMLENGADVHKSRRNKDVLCYAIELICSDWSIGDNDRELIELLIGGGADIYAENADGYTPLECLVKLAADNEIEEAEYAAVAEILV